MTVVMHAWASTLPHRDDHAPRIGDLCAIETCRQPLRSHEECYRVVERASDEWVCWRHVGPGPVVSP